LESDQEQDLSRWIWKRKAKAWESVNLTVVSPSKWLAGCARSSSLFQDKRIEVIPNGLDTQIYQPIERHLARARLKLPQDKLLILFGAMSSTSDRRKGFHLLQPALQKLGGSDWRDQVELVVFGSSRPKSEPSFGFKTHYLGSLSDDFALSLVYAVADVFVAPSVQENLPNTVMEALACGTPCVAFKIGGMADLIEHQLNGYLAYPFEIEDLANGIAWVLADKKQHNLLRANAREKADQEFTLAHQARQYVHLFQELIES
jgi:glycosyltransferase involved in cell wall biosynthesis